MPVCRDIKPNQDPPLDMPPEGQIGIISNPFDFVTYLTQKILKESLLFVPRVFLGPPCISSIRPVSLLFLSARYRVWMISLRSSTVRGDLGRRDFEGTRLYRLIQGFTSNGIRFSGDPGYRLRAGGCYLTGQRHGFNPQDLASDRGRGFNGNAALHIENPGRGPMGQAREKNHHPEYRSPFHRSDFLF
jgi:hypothetical protein